MGPYNEEEHREEMRKLWNYNFTNHKPTDEGIKKIEMMRSAAKALKDAYLDLAPMRREQSLALTKLEESLFFINGAIARHYTDDREKEEEQND